MRTGRQRDPAEQKNQHHICQVQKEVDPVVPGGVRASQSIVQKIGKISQLPALRGIQDAPYMPRFRNLRAPQEQAVIEVKWAAETAPVDPCRESQNADQQKETQPLHVRRIPSSLRSLVSPIKIRA